MQGSGPAPTLLEDLASAGADRFDLTVLSGRRVFERYLGEGSHSGIAVRFVETRQDEPERLTEDLRGARPDIRHIVDARTPLLAELFLPDHAGRLPADRNLFAVSSLNAIAAATALSLVDPAAAAELERRFSPIWGE